VEEPQVPETDPDEGRAAGSIPSHNTNAIATLDFDTYRNTYGHATDVTEINQDKEEARSFRLMPMPLYN
jgi:hypothetical protein